MKIIAALLILLANATSSETPGADDSWVRGTTQDSSNRTSNVFLRQDSAVDIRGETAGNEVTPRLQFQCAPGSAEIATSIDWRRFISSFNTEAGFKVDGGSFLWLKLKVDQTEQVSSSRSAEDTLKLIALLKSGRELLVEITPYSENPVIAEFDLTGFADAIVALATDCR